MQIPSWTPVNRPNPPTTSDKLPRTSPDAENQPAAKRSGQPDRKVIHSVLLTLGDQPEPEAYRHIYGKTLITYFHAHVERPEEEWSLAKLCQFIHEYFHLDDWNWEIERIMVTSHGSEQESLLFPQYKFSQPIELRDQETWRYAMWSTGICRNLFASIDVRQTEHPQVNKDGDGDTVMGDADKDPGDNGSHRNTDDESGQPPELEDLAPAIPERPVNDVTEEEEEEVVANAVSGMMENIRFQRENVEEAMLNLGVGIDGKVPWIATKTPMAHQVVGINWMVQQEDGPVRGGLLADDCGVGKGSDFASDFDSDMGSDFASDFDSDMGSDFASDFDSDEGSDICSLLLTLQTIGLIAFQATQFDEEAALSERRMKFPHATLIICPKQMVIEWMAAIGRDAPGDTVLQHHGDYDLRLSWSKCSAPEHLRVVVTTVETFKARWKNSRFLSPKGPGKRKAPPSRLWWEEKGVRPEFSRIVIDEAHRHNGAATPITTKVEDLRWVCKFLERPEMLRDNAANVWIDPTAADNRLEFVEGSETIVYNPEVIAKGSLVHCTLKAWDRHLQPDADTCSALQDWIKERQIQQPDGPDQNADSDDGLVEWQEDLDRLQAILTDRLGHFLESVMLRRSMASRIPFDSDRTILKVPAMEIRTEALPFDATDKPFHNTVFRGRMGNNPQRAYRYIRIVAMAPVLGPCSMMDPETHQVLLDTVYSSWDPDVNEVRKAFPVLTSPDDDKQ
ncbi:SNF2 family N-terminal domain-containing protein [Geopyxis carbonaria]|nr:SNF2 family N-terminal domain-containing protein [Geopyxis carbonaria]